MSSHRILRRGRRGNADILPPGVKPPGYEPFVLTPQEREELKLPIDEARPLRRKPTVSRSRPPVVALPQNPAHNNYRYIGNR